MKLTSDMIYKPRWWRDTNIIAFYLGALALGSYCALPLSGALNSIEPYRRALVIGSIVSFAPALASIAIAGRLTRKKSLSSSALSPLGYIGATMSFVMFALALLNLPYRWPYSPWPAGNAQVW